MRILKPLLQTDTSKTIILIRLMVGSVFLSEGIQKLFFVAQRGVGRFEAMGFPNPEFFGPFIGIIEMLAGFCILLGLYTRISAGLTFIIMCVAIVVTKLPIMFGASFGPFVLRELSSYGFWSMVHEMRTDWAMWLGSLFLIIRGAGAWSLDRRLTRRGSPHY